MFARVKQFLGIGGVTVSLNVPPSAPVDGSEISGTVTLTARSDQHITRVTIKMIEEYTTERGEDRKVRTYELGCVRFDQVFDMKPGDVKEIPFKLPYQLSNVQEPGGKPAYFIKAEAGVQGTFLDSTDKKDIRLV